MKVRVISCVLLCMAVAACDFLNPARPTIQPDTELFGNLVLFEEAPDQPGSYVVKVQVGSPRLVQKTAEEQGKVQPVKGDGVSAELLVDHNTVVLKDGMPAGLDDFSAGTEIVGIPVVGTTRMVGEKLILMHADLLCDFETYRKWRLPKLEGSKDEIRDDPVLVNSDGVEHAPVPLDGGRVLYFSARMRQGTKKGVWEGASREGLAVEPGSSAAPERSYRCEWSEGGWSKPELQVFPGFEAARVLRISWVDPAESRCFVTVVPAGEESPWVGKSEKKNGCWSRPEPLEKTEGGNSFDAVYLKDSDSKIVFATSRSGASSLDLYLIDLENGKKAMPLEPRINSTGSEWGPRIGPKNELYFCRADRQLAFWSNMVHQVVLADPFRVPITEVAPTAEGNWAFMTYSRLRAGEPDLDIWVAPLDEERNLGRGMPLEDWEPSHPDAN